MLDNHKYYEDFCSLNDECALCIHEHENFGDNKYCIKCEYSERNREKESKTNER